MGKARKRFEVFKADKVDLVEGQMLRDCWFWRLKAGNSRIIADGAEPYMTMANAIRAAEQLNDLLAEPLPIEIIR